MLDISVLISDEWVANVVKSGAAKDDVIAAFFPGTAQSTGSLPVMVDLLAEVVEERAVISAEATEQDGISSIEARLAMEVDVLAVIDCLMSSMGWLVEMFRLVFDEGHGGAMRPGDVGLVEKAAFLSALVSKFVTRDVAVSRYPREGDGLSLVVKRVG